MAAPEAIGRSCWAVRRRGRTRGHGSIRL